MNVPVTDRFTVDDAVEIYGLDSWGNGYFAINEQGRLIVSPERDPRRGIDVFEVVRGLSEKSIKAPLLLRFPQLLAGQVRHLAD